MVFPNVCEEIVDVPSNIGARSLDSRDDLKNMELVVLKIANSSFT